MKRHTKIISVVLALMLAAMLVPTALMQAFASDYEWEDTATDDEPGKVITVTSFEITKLPDVLSYYKDYPAIWELYDGLEMMITFSDGTVFNGSYYDEALNEMIYEKGIYNVYDNTNVFIATDLESLPLGKNTIAFEFCGYTDTLEITVSENDPRAIVKIELTKLPDKVFSAPYFTGERPDNEDFEAFTAFFDDLDDNNSIANNMQGAELTFYLANGEQYVYAFSEHEPAMCMYGQSVYPDCGILSITDLGDYKARIRYHDYHYLTEPFEQDFTVNYTGNSSATTVTDPTSGSAGNGSLSPSTAEKTSSSDTATDDIATTGSSDNSVIATGNTVYYFAAVMLLMCAGAAIVFFSRKRLSGLN